MKDSSSKKPLSNHKNLAKTMAVEFTFLFLCFLKLTFFKKAVYILKKRTAAHLPMIKTQLRLFFKSLFFQRADPLKTDS